MCLVLGCSVGSLASSRVPDVFKYFAINIRLSTDDPEVLLPHFLLQVYYGNDVM
jgi:hypothetical protein